MRIQSLPKILFAAFALVLSATALQAQVSEVEPNNTSAQANTLPLNGYGSGVINPVGDVDWWKVTTNADGLLNLSISNNTHYISLFLYDKNGVTLLNHIDYINSGGGSINTDGLAAGTYYVKVFCTNASDTSTYVVSNMLTTTGIANDPEPDSTRGQALVLPVNKSATGHVGYYYNNHRDSVDWYKISTTGDGQLILYMSDNTHYVSLILYDNNGTTILNSINYINSGGGSISTDGLAAGTYYVKVYCTNINTDFTPYTLKDSLFKPAQANDNEPDSNRATALTLPVNSTTTGHVGYYYNNHRDSTDWYKVTTTADGQLILYMSDNTHYVSLILYDNNGTSILNSLTYINSNGGSLSTDGLAAGTYYVKVFCTNINTDFTPYTLKDSLFKPAQANDNEPDSNRATALTLPVNSTTTGHVGYYYNNHRDSADWYKISLKSDGQLNLYMSNNTHYVSLILYDNDGISVLHSLTYINSDGGSIYTDGLAAGTYYVKVFCTYTNTDFTPYTLKDSLFTYNFTADTAAEPNNSAYLAKTLPANKVTTGHTGFYYNLVRDSSDWWKINYTGAGDLQIMLNFEPNIHDNGLRYFSYRVYSDTNAAAISSADYINTSSYTINLSSLSQKYYYVKLFTTNANSDFESYSIQDIFTQVTKAKIVFLDSTSNNTCGNDQLTFKLSDSHAPYMVRLYKNGNQVDSTTTSSTNVTFTGLNAGTYYATAFGDGATGNAFGKSGSIQFLPPYPTGLNTTNITTVAATLNWNPLSCVSSYQVQYHVKGNANWTIVNTTDPTVTLTGLISDTLYYWQVRSIDNTDGQDLISAYSSLDSFRTMAILPVTFLNFDGVIQNGKALLSWSTANEINNKGFEVQKSNNGQTFTDLGFVAGHNNSSTVNNYNYTDAKVVSGANYYRLKQIDNNGNFAYSSVIKLDYSAFDWSILGNPVSGNSWIQLQLDKSSEVSIQVVSMNGNIIQTINKGNLSAGTYSIPINLSGKSAGLYVVRLIVDGQPYSKKIVK